MNNINPNYIETLEENLDISPHKIGMRKSAGLYEGIESIRSIDAKHNPYHHSTGQRIIHREGRLAKLSSH